MFNFLRFKKHKETIIDFQFGAYYAIKLKKGYDVIRLLDLPGDSYHYQIIGSGWRTMPTLEQVKDEKPFVFHIPMEIVALIGKEVTRIGHKVLKKSDFIGYTVYLDAKGVEKKAINDHIKQLSMLSKHEPDRMRIFIENGEVQAEHLSI